MIQENEIRIGNLVMTNFKIENEIVEIQLIDFKEEYFCTYNPIPLTEEILLKFGFVYNGWNYEFSDLIFHAQGKNEKGEFYNTEFGINKGGKYTVISFRIDFVHRLQNIVYDIKGQELTFKN